MTTFIILDPTFSICPSLSFKPHPPLQLVWHVFWFIWSSSTERHNIQPECPSLRALLQPTAALQQRGGRVLGGRSIQAGSAACVCGWVGGSHVNLDVSFTPVKRKGRGESALNKQNDFLPGTSQCICVSEHVWLSSVHGKAESVRRNAVREMAGRTGGEKTPYVVKAEELGKETNTTEDAVWRVLHHLNKRQVTSLCRTTIVKVSCVISSNSQNSGLSFNNIHIRFWKYYLRSSFIRVMMIVPIFMQGGAVTYVCNAFSHWIIYYLQKSSLFTNILSKNFPNYMLSWSKQLRHKETLVLSSKAGLICPKKCSTKHTTADN